MKNIKKTLKHLWQDESGQGAMEYILLAVVIGVIVIAFKDKIVGIIEKQTEGMGGKLQKAMGNIGGAKGI